MNYTWFLETVYKILYVSLLIFNFIFFPLILYVCRKSICISEGTSDSIPKVLVCVIWKGRMQVDPLFVNVIPSNLEVVDLGWMSLLGLSYIDIFF